jgi:hypothetical protein
MFLWQMRLWICHLSVFLWYCDPMNDYKNFLTLISVIFATILISRDFREIIEHFLIKGHIQGRWIQNCFKGGSGEFRVQFSPIFMRFKKKIQGREGYQPMNHRTRHWYYSQGSVDIIRQLVSPTIRQLDSPTKVCFLLLHFYHSGKNSNTVKLIGKYIRKL